MSLLIIAFLSFANGTVTAKDASVSIGDYWEYNVIAQIQGSSLEGIIKMQMSSTQMMDISGIDTEIIVSKTSGNGTATMDFLGIPITGPFELSGTDVHVKSTFDLVSSNQVVDMQSTQSGFTLNYQAGFSAAFDPPSDIYVGDDNLSIGFQSDSIINATLSSWSDVPILGNTTYGPYNEEINVSIEATTRNVSITVPAGTFKCWGIEVTENNGPPFNIYYSEDVGNYVKIDGLDSELFMGDMELRSYSFAAGSSSMTLIIIGGGIIAAVIIVFLVAFIMLRRKRKSKKQAI